MCVMRRSVPAFATTRPILQLSRLQEPASLTASKIGSSHEATFTLSVGWPIPHGLDYHAAEDIEMTETKRNRRDFLKAAGLVTGAAAVVPWSAKSYAQIAGSNDRVRTAIVGCGDRMKQALVPAFLANCHETNFQFVAVSDIWNMRRDQGADMLTKKTGNKVDAVRNNDELYARKDIDAVLIATADFQHAQHGIEAVNAGRDAYVEKPTAHTMEDARNFRAAVHKTGKIVQIGTQRRSTPSYQKAMSTSRAASSVTSSWSK